MIDEQTPVFVKQNRPGGGQHSTTYSMCDVSVEFLACAALTAVLGEHPASTDTYTQTYPETHVYDGLHDVNNDSAGVLRPISLQADIMAKPTSNQSSK